MLYANLNTNHSILYEKTVDFFNAVNQIDWMYELGIFFVFITALLVMCNTRWGYKLPLKKMLQILAVVTFFAGCVLYAIGFAHRGNYGHSTFIIGAVIASAEMFLIKSEYSFISDACKDSHGYMLLFSVTYLMAVFCSIMFVLQIIGIRLGAWVKMFMNRLILPFSSDYELYVFIYPTKPVIQLAKSIYKQNRRFKRKVKFLFVCITAKGDKTNQGLTQLIGLNSEKKSIIDMILREDMDSLIIFCDNDIAECVSANADYLKISGINKTKDLFKYASSVKMLILTEDEKRNLEIAHKMAGDATVTRCDEDGKSVDIYCMARKSNTNLTLEDMMLKTNEDIHVMDASYLSVSTLKMNPAYLPVNFVECENGIVKSAFHSLIVGFNETGQEALKFLYEYGAFLGTDNRKSPFYCTAIDSKMESLKGKFYTDIPGLKEEKDIRLLQMTVGSIEFWEMMEQMIGQLNYIVIASGDDDHDIALAIDIYRFACRHRNNNLNRFKIFVRLYKEENEIKLVSLQRYFNQSNMKESGGGEIVVFGKEQDIYSYRMIILDEMLQKAKTAYETYNQLTNGSMTWQERRRKHIENKNLFSFQSLKRKETLDLSGAYHIDTKMILAGVKRPDKMTDNEIHKIQHLKNMLKSMHRENKQWVGVNPEDENFRLLENLAKTEHLRWNACHVLLGYLPDKGGNGCNEVTKRHNCLVSWEELLEYEADFQYYDYKFVELSLEIKGKENKRG